MRYLNPAPDVLTLTKLYCSGSVDPLKFSPANVPVSQKITPPKTYFQKTFHSVNGLLRGHPHYWPDSEAKRGSIFDFGCYTGEKLTDWYQLGWQIGGIDLNEQAIRVARRRFPEGKFWCGDLLTMDVPDRFDFIRADSVVEHLLDPIAYLKALINLLKPNGRLRVFVPNGLGLSARLFRKYSAVYWIPFHLNLFSPATLERALRVSGLINTQCRSFTPVGSWTWTQRQMLLKPGFNRRTPSWLDRIIGRLSLLNYPGETLAQWLGMGEELIGTGQKPA